MKIEIINVIEVCKGAINIQSFTDPQKAEQDFVDKLKKNGVSHATSYIEDGYYDEMYSLTIAWSEVNYGTYKNEEPSKKN